MHQKSITDIRRHGLMILSFRFGRGGSAAPVHMTNDVRGRLTVLSDAPIVCRAGSDLDEVISTAVCGRICYAELLVSLALFPIRPNVAIVRTRDFGREAMGIRV
jgi:hypothetical protein